MNRFGSPNERTPPNTGDFATGRAILRNYINATIGFPALAKKTNISSPSLQRMFGPKGNPSVQNLFGVIAALQQAEGVRLPRRGQQYDFRFTSERTANVFALSPWSALGSALTLGLPVLLEADNDKVVSDFYSFVRSLPEVVLREATQDLTLIVAGWSS